MNAPELCDSCAAAQGGGYVPNVKDSPAEFRATSTWNKKYDAKLCRGCADALRKFDDIRITPIAGAGK